MRLLIKKYILISLLILLAVYGFYITFGFLLPDLRPEVRVEAKYLDSLKVLSAKSLSMGEFPAGALVIYNDSIIGKGCNTTISENNIMGHAEINAIADVVKKNGFRRFKELDKKKLILCCSHEPCQMCQGVINHYQFGKVYFVNSKPLNFKLYYRKNSFGSQFKKRKIKTD